jgi:exodeoxyribonuclease V alpha subunit
VVVIDEASMLDLSTLYRILLRLGQARLLLVGDPAQLAPIGFGLTFHILVKAPAVPTVLLDRVHRQDEDSGIPAIAAAIRSGRMPDFEGFQGRRPGVSFIDCPADEAVYRIADIGRELIQAGGIRGETQILSPVRAGSAGITAINRHFHEARAGDRPRFPGRRDIAIGDPVIFVKNDAKLDLQNGSIGRFIALDGSAALVNFDGREVELTAAQAHFLELAYAISVHKAQGSSWPRVIVPVYRSRLLDRTLIYTAITRGQEQVVILGDAHAFARALAVEHGEARVTTLADRLNSTLLLSASVSIGSDPGPR